jgi:hypothetical protein
MQENHDLLQFQSQINVLTPVMVADYEHVEA